jgi:hypothetical protein
LERADTNTRYQAYNLAQMKPDGTGWMTTDEIRALEDLPPLDEAPPPAPPPAAAAAAPPDPVEVTP